MARTYLDGHVRSCALGLFRSRDYELQRFDKSQRGLLSRKLIPFYSIASMLRDVRSAVHHFVAIQDAGRETKTYRLLIGP
jgi:hypothetical protein